MAVPGLTAHAASLQLLDKQSSRLIRQAFVPFSTKQAASLIGIGVQPAGIAMGDFNKDGKLDLAVAARATNQVYLFLGNGNGTFTQKSILSTRIDPIALVQADLNGDGKLDLASANNEANTVSIALGNGDGTLQASTTRQTSGREPSALTMGNFNGDAAPDLVVVDAGSSSFCVLLGPL